MPAEQPSLNIDSGARRWGLVVGDGRGGINVDATQTAFLAAYPDRDADEVKDMIGVAFELAGKFAHDGDASSKDYEFHLLFDLARELMAKAGAARDKRGPEGGQYFAPYARLFRDALESYGALPRCASLKIDWTDTDLVLLRFEGTWQRVRSAKGDNLLLEAFAFAQGDSLVLDGYDSPRLRLLIAMAYHLQNRQGSKPILLPVEKLGGLLSVTPSCVSDIIGVMVGRKLLKVMSVDYSYANHKAKEYKFIGKIARRDHR